MALNPKLLALSGDALIKLREEVNAAFNARAGEFLKVGRYCRLYSEKKGRDIRLQITGFGIKYVQAAEVNEFGNPTGVRWRCRAANLYPELPKVKPTVVRGAGADAPQHAMAGSF